MDSLLKTASQPDQRLFQRCLEVLTLFLLVKFSPGMWMLVENRTMRKFVEGGGGGGWYGDG